MAFKKLSVEELRLHKGLSFTGITTVFYCYDGAGRLLLGKRSENARDEHGRWDPGGGGLKHGQSVEETLDRELMEEYGTRPLKTDFLDYFDAFRTNEAGLHSHWLALCFAVLVDPEKVSIKEPDMIDEIGWFTLDGLPSPMHSQFEVALGRFGDKLREIIDKK